MRKCEIIFAQALSWKDIEGVEKEDRIKPGALFFWTVHELGILFTELAGRLGINVADVGYWVRSTETHKVLKV